MKFGVNEGENKKQYLIFHRLLTIQLRQMLYSKFCLIYHIHVSNLFPYFICHTFFIPIRPLISIFSAIWNMTPCLFHYKISIPVSAKLDRFHFTCTYTITFTWDSMLRSLQIASKGWISGEKKISDDVGIFINSFDKPYMNNKIIKWKFW